jgi:hypothetical protein
MTSDHTNPSDAEPPHATAGDEDPPERPPADFLVVARPDLGQSGLRSLRAFAAGDRLTPFTALRVHDAPSRMTVQVSGTEHIELAPAWLAFTNHSCDPNTRFDPDVWHLVAERDIAPGDELTFFYPSTEWDMATPFDCHCGASSCIGRVDGASRVPAERLGGRWLARHIRDRLASRG